MMESVRLLIAEDEDNIRDGIADHIRQNARYIDEIYSVSNGQEAMDCLLHLLPQLMLLDIQMPLKDGISVLEEATAAGVCPRTVILSGHGDFQYAQQAIHYNVEDYLLKPCRASEMLEKLDGMAREIKNNQNAAAPRAVGSKEPAQTGNKLVTEAMEYIRQQYHSDINLTSVADEVGITPSYLSSLFTNHLACGFVDYLNKIRIDHACTYFANTRLKTYEVAYKVGFRGEKYFSSVFKKVMGMTPSEYRKKVRGALQ